ncbi:coiled-coil domain-containing protein 12 [Myzus persicae]|uniref:coiled-coil domain-containing protein 12 n=1 Tax=Myzus persicae TaxID=13164 RepID=UPI000B9329E6|nr:coiled-coil domain-containing protein 12 [Myzus persicae]XP_022177950.1 coiled-coil domain-containing protein 12 [Myzus persicae]XP_022177951.1 coiled-coil domain-containing protein 12 [Myzus persicae]
MENSENQSIKVGLLEEEARKRKERLANLKKSLENKNNQKNNEDSVEKPLPKPRFKSYIPEDEGLKAELIPTPQPGDIVAEVEDQLKAGETVFTVQELDLNTLAPRKPDWDLKRDIEKRMTKLERRTQRAIAELIRDRLKGEQNIDLAMAVNEGARANAQIDNDEE